MIHFGRISDNDRQFNILKGRLSLSKDEVRSTFDDVIWRIFGSCVNLFPGQKVKVSSTEMLHDWVTNYSLALAFSGRFWRVAKDGSKTYLNRKELRL